MDTGNIDIINTEVTQRDHVSEEDIQEDVNSKKVLVKTNFVS